jgi:hypothetical protein
MAGHSRPKDGVASLAYVPAIHVFLCCQDVDARHKAGHDGGVCLAQSGNRSGERSMTKRPADDHKVGYRKPPVHSRFRKGQSSNPGGRPRGMTAGRATALALKEAYRSVKEMPRSMLN